MTQVATRKRDAVYKTIIFYINKAFASKPRLSLLNPQMYLDNSLRTFFRLPSFFLWGRCQNLGTTENLEMIFFFL